MSISATSSNLVSNDGTTATTSVARCRVSLFDFIRVHDETQNRYVSPLTLSFVQIPGVVWPNLFVGCESSGLEYNNSNNNNGNNSNNNSSSNSNSSYDNVNNNYNNNSSNTVGNVITSVYKQSSVDISRTDVEFRFLRDLWFELIRVCTNDSDDLRRSRKKFPSLYRATTTSTLSSTAMMTKRENGYDVEQNCNTIGSESQQQYQNSSSQLQRQQSQYRTKSRKNCNDDFFANNRIDDSLRYFNARSLGSFSWTTLTGSNPYVYFVLLQTVRRMTRGRINFLNNHRYRVDSIDRPFDDRADRNEFVDSCLPCVISLGASRLTLSQRMQRIVDEFAVDMKQLKISIVDMKQCENLLRETIRSYHNNDANSNSATSVTTIQSFDLEKALQDVFAQDVVVTLKKYVAFVSALQTRKWRTIDESMRLAERLKRFERREPGDNGSITSDMYRALLDQLKSERSNVSHLSQQLSAMRKIIDNTRRLLVEIYNRMYVTWDETNDLTVRLRDTLRSYRVEPTTPFREYLRRDIYVLDFFRCLELVRSTNMLLMKRVEDAYEDAFERALPIEMRDVRLDVGYDDNRDRIALAAANASLSLGCSITERVTVDTVMSALNDLNRWILLTREHYTRSEWSHGPMDVRRMVLAFNRAIDLRLMLVSRSIGDDDEYDNVDDDDDDDDYDDNGSGGTRASVGINDTIDVERELTNGNDRKRIDNDDRNSFNDSIGRNVNGNLTGIANGNNGNNIIGDNNNSGGNNSNDNSRSSSSSSSNKKNRTSNNNDYSRSRYRGTNDAVARTLNRRERVRAQLLFTSRIEIGQQRRQMCRPLGSVIVLLRETQDAYDVVYLTRMLEMQFDRLLTSRYSCGNSRIDRDAENRKLDERRMLKELEQATRSTFKQAEDTWDRLIARVRMYERETTFDADTRDGMKPRELLSTRLEEWCFRSLDSFNFTQIQARFTGLDRPGELALVQKTISRYAYLLSWLLQMRMYVPFDSVDTDRDHVNGVRGRDSDDIGGRENFYSDGEDGGDREDEVNPDKGNEYDDGDVLRDETVRRNAARANRKRQRVRGDNDEDYDDAKRIRANDRVVRSGVADDRENRVVNRERNRTRKRNYNETSAEDTGDDRLDDRVKRPRVTNATDDRDVVMGTDRIGLTVTDDNDDGDDFQFDDAGDAIIRDNVFPSRIRRRASKRRRETNDNDNDQNDEDPLAKRSRGATSSLTRLQRLAENAPQSISVRLLNDAFRDETAKKREIRSNIRKTLNRVVSTMRLVSDDNLEQQS